jgi:hypothetical protein
MHRPNAPTGRRQRVQAAVVSVASSTTLALARAEDAPSVSTPPSAVLAENIADRRRRALLLAQAALAVEREGAAASSDSVGNADSLPSADYAPFKQPSDSFPLVPMDVKLEDANEEYDNKEDKLDDDDDDDDEEEEEEEEEEELGAFQVVKRPRYISAAERAKLAPGLAKVELPTSPSESEIADSTALLRDLLQRERGGAAAAPADENSDASSSESELDDGELSDEWYVAWKLRELDRFRADMRQALELELQKAEREAHRSLSDSEAEVLRKILAGDSGNAEIGGTEPRLESRRFLQKYYHRGAFFQDDEYVQRLDADAPTGADRETDRTTLPAVLQVRDFGKSHRSKWTHLAAEDTTYAGLARPEKYASAGVSQSDDSAPSMGDLARMRASLTRAWHQRK